MTDAELEAEARRRRQARGGKAASGSRFDTPASVLKALRSLELGASASRQDVQKSYLRLLKKYDPEKRKGDPKKYESAKKLTAALGEAYREIIAYFDERPRMV